MRPLPRPAPFSIKTLCSRETKPATPVGVTATRFSSVLISLGTPTIIDSSYVKVYAESTRREEWSNEVVGLSLKQYGRLGKESRGKHFERFERLERFELVRSCRTIAKRPRREVANPREKQRRRSA